MNKIREFLLQQRANYSQWDFLVFVALTLLSILNGQTTVFYLIYFFWWNELLRLLIDRILYKKNTQSVFLGDGKSSVFSSLFIMAIYFVFIVVFFGFIAASDSTELIIVNMEALFFQNWFFNCNLIFVILERIYLHKSNHPLQITFGGFTPNMIILHISIIMGGMLLFFVVKNFPETFTPKNLWGSVLIALPFLLLKMGASYLSNNTISARN